MNYIKRVVQRGVNNRFLRGVASLTSANAAGQLILLACMPLLTRLYTPDDFGVFAVFTAVMSVVLVASSLRYELAIPLPRKVKDAQRLLSIALLINLFSVLIVAVVVLSFGKWIAGWTNTPSLTKILWLLPIVIFVAGTYKALKFWAVRQKDFSAIAMTRISQSIANAVAQIIGGLAGLGVWGLVIGQTIGQSAGVRSLSRDLPISQFISGAFSNRLRTKALIRKYKKFPKYDVPGSVVNTVSVQLPNFLLAVLFNPMTAGIYYLADRALATPMTMVSQAVAQVLYGDIRSLLAAGVARQRCYQLLLVMTFIGLPPTLLLFFYAEPLFALVFGEEWRDAGLYASWLIFGLLVQFLYSPLSMILMATDGQAANFLIHLLISALKLCALLMAYIIESEIVAVIGIGFATALGYGIGVFIVFSRLPRFELNRC